MDAPEILPSDFAKFDRPGQLHIAFKALNDYQDKYGSLPRPRCQVGCLIYYKNYCGDELYVSGVACV
jgi:ubiquitin-activating enzyme E1